MKTLSFFLLLCLTFNLTFNPSVQASSMVSCSELFEGKPIVKLESLIVPREFKSSGDVLLDVFSKILNAPKNSTVKIFTKNISSDGIGALLLLVSVQESSLKRGLKFEFYLEENSKVFRMHHLYTENSTNKIRFKNNTENEFSNKTIVAVESENGTSAIGFDGDLMSASLKNFALRKAVPVHYDGIAVLRASPFRTIGVDDQVDITKINTTNYNLDLSEKIDINDNDIGTINRKAIDLAIQLYMFKRKEVPQKSMSSLEILDELVKKSVE